MRQRGLISSWARLWCVVSAVTVASACGDDDADSDRNGAGGDTASGLVDGGLGPMRRPDGGASAGSSADADTYRCQPKTIDPGGAAPLGAACCGGLGTCTGAAVAQPGLPHDACSALPDLRCEPLAPLADVDAGVDSDAGVAGSPSCRVELPGTPEGGPAYEGRCVSACFAQQLAIFPRLRQTTCSTGEICAPCYDPLTGNPTGTCSRHGDSPNEPKPAGFEECGSNNAGYCIPGYSAGSQASQLVQLTCAAGQLCAPKIKAADPNACFAHCTSALGPGSCVPDFLAGMFSAALMQMDCKTSELCAPCEVFGTRLGVCD